VSEKTRVYVQKPRLKLRSRIPIQETPLEKSAIICISLNVRVVISVVSLFLRLRLYYEDCNLLIFHSLEAAVAGSNHHGKDK
jgi:hypothetical protein